MAWNTTHTAGLEWSEAAFLNTYAAATNERIRAKDDVGAADASLMVDVAADDDVQDDFNSLDLEHTLIGNLQNQVENELPDGWVSTMYWDGATHTPISDWSDKATIQRWTFGGTAPKLAGGILPGTHFTRKFTREISTPLSATYASSGGGSPSAYGEKARARSDGRVYVWTDMGGFGEWVWVGDLTTQPDIVTAYGQIVANDIIGHWLFNELRDCLNALWQRYHPFDEARTDDWWADWADGLLKNYTSGIFGSLAAAKADVEANYAGAGTNPNGAAPYRFTGVTAGFTAEYQTATTQPEVSCQGQYDSEVDWYIFLDRYPLFGGSDDEFQDFGAGYTEDSLQYFGFDAKPAATTTLQAAGLGTNAAPSPWVWPAGTEPQGAGWLGTGVYGVERMTGFTYKA